MTFDKWLEQQAHCGWQPIDTAPRDGTWILLTGGRCGDESAYPDTLRTVSAQWTNELNGEINKKLERWQFAWNDGGYDGEYSDPTHWMPLPEPPMADSR